MGENVEVEMEMEDGRRENMKEEDEVQQMEEEEK